MTQTIAVIRGDGIGPEIMDATLHVLDALKLGLQYDFVDAGLSAYEKTGELLPAATLDAIHKHRIALKSPLTTPVGEGFSSINVELRKRFDLYANVRPAISFPNTKSRYQNIDLITVRENTEGAYIGEGQALSADGQTATLTQKVTRRGSERIVRYAFDLARRIGRKKVTIVHKANILKSTSGLFLRVAREVAAELEVSERTARRDLEALSTAGIPVYSSRGYQGGWQLLGGARTDLTGLRAPEAEALLMMAAVAGRASPDFASAMQKLTQALPAPIRADAERAMASVISDDSSWHNRSTASSAQSEDGSRWLDPLRRATDGQIRVEIVYEARKGTSTRTVDPLGLVTKRRTWYMLADTTDGSSATLLTACSTSGGNEQAKEPTTTVASSTSDKGTTTTAKPAPDARTIDWEDCGGGFQCGTITVPLDYSKPDGKTIDADAPVHFLTWFALRKKGN